MITFRDRIVRAAAILPLVAMLGGCEMALHDLRGSASDSSTKSYPLAEGGIVEIDNVNGKIDLQGTDTPTVEITTERIAKAATDEGARQLLPNIKIEESASPDHITIKTGNVSGVLIGASYEVRYTIRAPRSAVL